MNKTIRILLLWSPRILCILFAVFISLFSLDVFAGTHGLMQTIVGLLIHLIPTFVIVGVLILSWRWEWIGAVAYVGMAVFYAYMINFRRWDWIALISTPLLIIGILFLVSWLLHDKLRVKEEQVQ
ncbi:MAG: hypothetical protein A2X61_17115 [Ignavibacteria bacterium GWB2_35_12]|nr:MAG: hypothetical protein A2X61_17115 [Ignavibacteria bacterium GWB2_35_12]OGU94522.1 MAG: hypothetical protein A2220_01450 [Ignavibacteria bacterium RIFOXYA2_FULL_35_10]OGV19083.1 MAG: hypothetical protein A2475_07655 [Ignavibacteria bacterium RIFOXYC2_FULL_35_21]